MNDQPRVLFVPAEQDPLRALAQRICSDQATTLPDLARVSIVVPHAHLAPLIRRELLLAAQSHGHAALLAPHIETLRALAVRCGPIVQTEIGGYARELLLAEALTEHAALYGKANPWQLAENLLQLFDALTNQHATLPDSLDDFVLQLAKAYGVRDTTPQALGREATLVHTLWHAWHAQLSELGVVDEHVAHLVRLASIRDAFSAQAPLYCACFSEASRAEASWLADVAARGGVTLVIHQVDEHALPGILGAAHARHAAAASKTSARADFFDTVFDADSHPLRERARRFADANPSSPVANSMTLLAAASNEDEARAVDVQVRRWLLEGLTRVGVVTEDRRLARRVRALLERANVTVDDYGGWALSTTSAATVLERWLQCVEQDFAYQPLLDVLKSPFVTFHADHAEHLRCVYRLEEDIIRNENVTRGLQRYRNRIAVRRRRLPGEMGTHYPPVESLLDRIQIAAAPMTELLGLRARAPVEFLDALQTSVERLGLASAWATDAAGQRIVQVLAELGDAARQTRTRMRWTEWRAWLGRALEHNTFVPQSAGRAVHILALAQSAGMMFDAVVIAGCDRDHLPGPAAASPFFNSSVRAELGLPTEAQRIATRQAEFRRLLLSAPRLVLTRVRQRSGEIVIASPWWSRIQTFHQFAYGNDLGDRTLAALIGDSATDVMRGEPGKLPEQTQRPRVRIDPRLVPTTYSANSYDRLIACPYQFFAAHALKLKAAEPIRHALQKDDYGKRVHRCLEAFFRRVEGLPDPFPKKITAANRAEAIAALEHISHAVFHRDLDDNFQHRAWLKQWLRTIPNVVDWEIEQSGAWVLDGVEVQRQREFVDTEVHITGRLDRVDRNDQALRIIDYKTGQPPRPDAVRAGESIQLSFYVALMGERAPAVVSAEYLAIGNAEVKSTSRVEAPELQQLMHDAIDRLKTLHEQLKRGQPVTAWGDADACSHCSMDGLCRRAYWEDNEELREEYSGERSD